MRKAATVLAASILVSGCALEKLHPGYENMWLRLDNGFIYKFDENGRPTEEVGFDFYNQSQGGRLYDHNSQYVGFVDKNGRIFNEHGSYVGRIQK